MKCVFKTKENVHQKHIFFFYTNWFHTLYPNLILYQNEIPLIFCLLRRTYLVAPLVWLLAVTILNLLFYIYEIRIICIQISTLYMKTTMITDDNNKILYKVHMHECMYKIWVALALHLVEWSCESTDSDPIQMCWRETHGSKETDSFLINLQSMLPVLPKKPCRATTARVWTNRHHHDHHWLFFSI